jgi:hypothetical protein
MVAKRLLSAAGCGYRVLFTVRSPSGVSTATIDFATVSIPTSSQGAVVVQVVVPPGGGTVTAVISDPDFCMDSTGHIPAGHVEACAKRLRTYTLGKVTIRHAHAGRLRIKLHISRRERRILRATGKHTMKGSRLTVRVTPKRGTPFVSKVRFKLRF